MTGIRVAVASVDLTSTAWATMDDEPGAVSP
jgi:hypothetical protein